MPIAHSLNGKPSVTTRIDSPWIGLHTVVPAAPLRLIAFHHAGGNTGFYQPWLKVFQALDWVEFLTVQLPGRGRRLAETPISDLDSLLDALDKGVDAWMDKPCVLFGFSMGAILAFELALRRQRCLSSMPKAVVLAGRGAPPANPRADSRAGYSKERILGELRRLGGTAPALLEDGPFLDVHLRTFQADFAAADAHHHAEPALLHCPLYAWGGADDPEASIERIALWERHAGADFAWHLFPGGHFFPRTAQAAVLGRLLRILDTTRKTLC